MTLKVTLRRPQIDRSTLHSHGVLKRKPSEVIINEYSEDEVCLTPFEAKELAWQLLKYSSMGHKLNQKISLVDKEVTLEEASKALAAEQEDFNKDLGRATDWEGTATFSFLNKYHWLRKKAGEWSTHEYK